MESLLVCCKPASAMLLLLILLGATKNTMSSSKNHKGSWQFPSKSPPYPCIVFNAKITLYLTYTDTTEKQVDAVVDVLPSSTVDENQSSCGKMMIVENQPIFSQILHINLDHYPGWDVRFAFSNDKRLNADGWVLYQVNVTADYPATKTLFPNPPDIIYNYFQPVDLKNPPAMADTIFAHLNRSYCCTSEQRLWINSDTKQGPLATFKISHLQVESFKVTTPQASNEFDPREICPYDQRPTDIVPVFVGSCLAGLIVITLITYLVYRWQLPHEALRLENTQLDNGSHRMSHVDVDVSRNTRDQSASSS